MLNPALRAINEWQHSTFEFGRTDCCQFANFVIQRLTGRDCIPWNYSNEREAIRIIAAHGGLGGAVTEALGEPCEGEMKPGDVVLWKIGGDEGVGIAVSPSQLAALGRDGFLAPLGSDCVVQFWRVR